MIAVNAGSAVLGFMIVATPIGWVGLIIGGLAVTGVAAGASMSVNNLVKGDAGRVYDSILKLIEP
ncbi:MAG: hypothetical protein GY820_09860 [Gammaproteobacteria bacterium]|nr:hypothetical protein [Gammaproteobacteria bacterium]